MKVLFAHLLPVLTPDEEIVVVDGESTDGSKEFLQGLYDSNKINQFISEPDANQAHGWNKALLMAKGTIIKKLIDDDVPNINAIRKCRDFMLSNPDIDVCISNTLAGVLADPDRCESKNRLSYFYKWEKGETRAFTFSDVSMLKRKSSLSLFGLYDTQFRMIDWEYSLRLSFMAARIAYYTGYNAMSVDTIGNITSTATKEQLKREESIGKIKYQYPGDMSGISFYSMIKVRIGETLDKLKKQAKKYPTVATPAEPELSKIYSTYYQKLEEYNRKSKGDFFC